jgi:hypothetical protein
MMSIGPRQDLLDRQEWFQILPLPQSFAAFLDKQVSTSVANSRTVLISRGQGFFVATCLRRYAYVLKRRQKQLHCYFVQRLSPTQPALHLLAKRLQTCRPRQYSANHVVKRSKNDGSPPVRESFHRYVCDLPNPLARDVELQCEGLLRWLLCAHYREPRSPFSLIIGQLAYDGQQEAIGCRPIQFSW